MSSQTIRLTTVVERHHPRTPRYVIIPSALVATWNLEGTTVVTGTIDGVPIDRRSLKSWDDERWFMDLPERLCRVVGCDTGDRVTLALSIASSELPQELAAVLARSAQARRNWERLTPSRRRMIREHVLEARQSATRMRRARRALGLDGGLPP